MVGFSEEIGTLSNKNTHDKVNFGLNWPISDKSYNFHTMTKPIFVVIVVVTSH